MTFLFFFAAIHVQQQPAQSSKTITRGRTVGRAEARRERDRGRRASMIPDQVASRRARARERYANETPEQRQARRVRQNARNAMRRTTPGPNYVVGSGVTGTNNASTCILQGESSTGTSQIINCGNAANNNKISHEICLLKHDVPFLFCSSYYIYTCAAITSTIIRNNHSW